MPSIRLPSSRKRYQQRVSAVPADLTLDGPGWQRDVALCEVSVIEVAIGMLPDFSTSTD